MGTTGVWRGLGYLLWLVPSALVGWLLLCLVLVTAMSTVVAGVGVVLLPAVVVGVQWWVDRHRRLAGAVLGVEIPLGYRPSSGSVGARWRRVWTDRGTWRDLAWLGGHGVVGLACGLVGLFFAGTPIVTAFSMFFWWVRPAEQPLHLLVGVPLSDWGVAIGLGLAHLVVLVPSGLLLVPRIAAAHASFTRALSRRSAAERLAERVGELTSSRAGAVDAHQAELRRIERDLHDGTQARLVAIAIRAGIAQDALVSDPAAAATLLQDVQDGAEEAMGELRAIVRAMYPPILADRGLAGAVHALAAQAAVPTRVQVGDLGRLAASVEAAAYFTVSEALTNVARHASARAATVCLSRGGSRLSVTVTDDGCGGAEEERGTGIAGIRRRVAALDGSLRVDSPVGGPTSITVELPCES